MNRRILYTFVVASIAGAIVLAACGPSSSESAGNSELVGAAGHQEAAGTADEHAATDEHGSGDEHGEAPLHSPEDHMAGMHNVPEEAAAVPNPIAASDESIAAGAELFATNCAICHGENGEGDGPAAASLDPKPADLHADHVQSLTDGGFFYIISHGKPDTPMPAWENVLAENERWHVINFLRTFGE